MTFQPDLDAYFQRIGDDGSRTPTLATLARVLAAHVKRIPFENLDILLGRAISLEPRALEQKLVHGERGGYCFEQNGLLLQVLEALGFDVQPISARVRGDAPRSASPNRTHLFLRVNIDGKPWLADVGVGAMTPMAPLALELDLEQAGSFEPRRIVADGNWMDFDMREPGARLFHQVQLNGQWTDVCDFTLEEMHASDRELANWFTSTHPNSKFRTRLSMARVVQGGRVSLLNQVFKQRNAAGKAEQRRLRSPQELLDCIAEHFGVHLPAGTRFDCVPF